MLGGFTMHVYTCFVSVYVLFVCTCFTDISDELMILCQCVFTENSRTKKPIAYPDKGAESVFDISVHDRVAFGLIYSIVASYLNIRIKYLAAINIQQLVLYVFI